MNKKSKILHAITDLGLGGTENTLLNLLPKLTDFEHIICYFENEDSFLADEFRKQGIEVYSIRSVKKSPIKAICDLNDIIKSKRPDMIIGWLLYADSFVRIFGRAFGVNKIISSIRSTLKEKRYLPWLIFNRLSAPLINEFVVNSQSSKIMYSKKWRIQEDRIKVITNGVHIEKFDRLVEIDKKKKEVGIPSYGPIIGCVGNLRREKGQRYLIKALPEIMRSFPDATIALAGDGSEREELERIIAELGVAGNVCFLGRRTDVPELLKVFDIFVNPSLYEGMSNTILEAMAARCAIIASDIPENRELVTNMKSGLLVSFGDVKGLAQAVIFFLKNPQLRDACKNKAFSEVMTNFSFDKMVRQWDGFLKGALNV